MSKTNFTGGNPPYANHLAPAEHAKGSIDKLQDALEAGKNSVKGMLDGMRDKIENAWPDEGFYTENGVWILGKGEGQIPVSTTGGENSIGEAVGDGGWVNGGRTYVGEGGSVTHWTESGIPVEIPADVQTPIDFTPVEMPTADLGNFGDVSVDVDPSDGWEVVKEIVNSINPF